MRHVPRLLSGPGRAKALAGQGELAGDERTSYNGEATSNLATLRDAMLSRRRDNMTLRLGRATRGQQVTPAPVAACSAPIPPVKQ